jgi:hypothetical protein
LPCAPEPLAWLKKARLPAPTAICNLCSVETSRAALARGFRLTDEERQ